MDANISALRHNSRLAKIDFQQAEQFLLVARDSIKRVQNERNCRKVKRASVRIAKAIALLRLAEGNLNSILREDI